MTEKQNQPQKTSLQQLGILFKPKNLLRTVASAAPGAAAFTEMQSQLDGAILDERIASLEKTDLSLQAKVMAIESSQPKNITHESNWPVATGDYLRRVVDIAVVFDGAVNSPRYRRGLRCLAAHGSLRAIRS